MSYWLQLNSEFPKPSPHFRNQLEQFLTVLKSQTGSLEFQDGARTMTINKGKWAGGKNAVTRYLGVVQVSIDDRHSLAASSFLDWFSHHHFVDEHIVVGDRNIQIGTRHRQLRHAIVPLKVLASLALNAKNRGIWLELTTEGSATRENKIHDRVSAPIARNNSRPFREFAAISRPLIPQCISIRYYKSGKFF